MKHDVSKKRGLRFALILVALLTLAGVVPAASGAASRPAPRAIPLAAPVPEVEPNNTIGTAMLLPFPPPVSGKRTRTTPSCKALPTVLPEQVVCNCAVTAPQA